jgi:hypothetical protein
MAGIEKTKEVLKSAKEAIMAVQAILEDGQITLKDARLIPSIVGDLKVIVAHVKAVKEEAADYDKEELQEVVGLMVDIALELALKLGVE